MTDASGSTVAEYAYSPYGQIMNHTGVDTHYNWIGTYGVWQEGADMFQMKARYYNATLRRFVTPDPIGVNGGFNLYVYANSNPVFFLDPLGLLSVSLFDGNDDGRIRDVAGGTDFSAAAKRIDIFRYDMGDDADLSGAISYIERVKKLGFTIDNIYLWDHGGVDYGQEYNDSKLHELPNAKHDMKIIGELMTSDGVVHFMGCSVGGEGGHLQEYANSFNRKVTASSVPVYYGFCNNLLGVYRVFFYVESKMPEEKKWF
ncbi:MAG: RHS repeat-associated core domain-containing protein [Verrucomicrobiae bacterium]|nr:RHS repeat-associated core domain-containing protein [Verrucomicrobiae bacterium]